MSNDEEYDEVEIERAEQARDLIAEICGRCDSANIEYEDNTVDEDGFLDVDLTVLLPSGRIKREIDLWDKDDLEDFNDIKFEKYLVIGNYAAICCLETRTIEAAFSIMGERDRPLRLIKRRILKTFGVEFDNRAQFQLTELSAGDSSHKTKLFISNISKELQVLTEPTTSIKLSIIIQANKLSSHADAVKLLEKMSHSVFFSADVKNGIALTLLRRTQNRHSSRLLGKSDSIEYPKYEYDHGPISLYWYARNAINMPLLQFLAYYQIIEFYFPIYFKAGVNRKIRTILKDPAFEVERDSDVSRITSVINLKPGGRASEKDQLKATFRECLENSDIQDFIETSEKRMKFLTSKQKGISQYSINLKNKNVDLVNQVANRIYDIRCKVVHVKSEDGDNEVELLLPYTEESEKLIHDIDLVQFIAKKVLICSSTPLRI